MLLKVLDGIFNTRLKK